MKKTKKKEPSTFGYKLVMFFIRPLFKFYYSPKIIGKEKIPETGPIVIAGNHIHVYDQCSTIAVTKRPISYMAKREYFEGKLAPFFRFVGCIPVNRSGTDFEAMKSALRVLKGNGAVGIFPEGTRNKTDEFMLPFKPGAVALAKKADAIIVPFGVTGDYKFRSKNLITRFGEPFSAKDMTVEEATEKLYNEVKRLMEENLKETGDLTVSSEKVV
ncbi:MAG: 1-acyl-sn-glycerol-3-phosphate acyltransferase [Clostridia bacterium]|nr:1-acyl-sn-glycerol-3-phosphate acyltransferase [Clostridia bacterium]MBQ7047197.1 1-acyl-sn-glycerol-3-phosphate acyltransferase [Oscillospiraceae bacterium]